MTYQEIRKQQYDYHANVCQYSKDWNWSSPYTYAKSRLYMEGASAMVYLLQYTHIHPNVLTISYAILAIIGGVLLCIPYRLTTAIAISIFFLKGILDLADGHYARLTHQTSYIGKQLDYHAGKIGTIAFYAGLTIHLVQVNVYALVYLPILYAMHKLDGRARTVDLICLLLLLEIFIT